MTQADLFMCFYILSNYYWEDLFEFKILISFAHKLLQITIYSLERVLSEKKNCFSCVCTLKFAQYLAKHSLSV